MSVLVGCVFIRSYELVCNGVVCIFYARDIHAFAKIPYRYYSYHTHTRASLSTLRVRHAVEPCNNRLTYRPVRFQPLSTPGMVGPPPRIFDFIIQLRFDEVLKRVGSHPHEASYPHPRRWTALHACVEYGAPLEVVKALVYAYPDALEMKDWRGLTPIDIALSEELKEYLASVDIESLLEEQRHTLEENDGTNTTASSSSSLPLSGDVSRDKIIQQLDKISIQARKLNHEINMYVEGRDEGRRKEVISPFEHTAQYHEPMRFHSYPISTDYAAQ